MKFLSQFFLLLLILFSFGSTTYAQEVKKTTLTADEQQLYKLIMTYRKSKGLKPIPISNSLTKVAQAHCYDLVVNKPDTPSRCNAHSWSDKGSWSSCCYTADHKQAKCMWNKPKEFSNYIGNGYEIAAGSSEPNTSDYKMSPEYALKLWKGSVHHNDVILNKSIWKDMKWNAIGVGMKDGIATVWFGVETDPEGAPDTP